MPLQATVPVTQPASFFDPYIQEQNRLLELARSGTVTDPVAQGQLIYALNDLPKTALSSWQEANPLSNEELLNKQWTADSWTDPRVVPEEYKQLLGVYRGEGLGSQPGGLYNELQQLLPAGWDYNQAQSEHRNAKSWLPALIAMGAPLLTAAGAELFAPAIAGETAAAPAAAGWEAALMPGTTISGAAFPGVAGGTILPEMVGGMSLAGGATGLGGISFTDAGAEAANLGIDALGSGSGGGSLSNLLNQGYDAAQNILGGGQQQPQPQQSNRYSVQNRNVQMPPVPSVDWMQAIPDSTPLSRGLESQQQSIAAMMQNARNRFGGY